MNPQAIKTRQKSQAANTESFNFRHSVVALALAGAVMTPNALYAADDKAFADLQAENARLRQELENFKNGSAASQPAVPVVQAAASVPDSGSSDAAADQPIALDAVVVRSRNRLERVKDIPVSISVVSGQELERLNARDISALAKRTANISWGQGNARTSSLSIRGIGKQAQTDAMDPSVGITVDGVSYAYNPFASFDLYDIDSVEVARGPQGTQGGKNATVGSVRINTRRPSFKSSADFSVTLGQNGRVIADAAMGGAIIDDVLAWRGAISADKSAGYYPNTYNKDFGYFNKDNVSGRVSFLYTPKPGFEALVKFEVTPRHEEYANGWTFNKPTPTTYADGTANTALTNYQRLSRSWFTGQQGVYNVASDYYAQAWFADNQRPLVTETNGASAVLTWNLDGNYTLTSISGYKDFYFQARNDEGSPFDVSKNGGGFVSRDYQWSQELRIASPLGGFVDYQAGLYYLSQFNNYVSKTGFGTDAGAWFATAAQYTTLGSNASGQLLMQNALRELQTNIPQTINSKSQAIYGQANWHLSEPLTLTTGVRVSLETRDNSSTKYISNQGFGSALNPVALGGFNGATPAGAAQIALADSVALQYFGVPTYAGLNAAQQAQVVAAQALRAANIGTLYGLTNATRWQGWQPTLLLSPSYKFNEDVTGYVSLQYGRKAGIAQVNALGNPFNAQPERNTSYELGFKSSLLDRTLTLNADIFYSRIADYQQAVQVLDPIATAQAGTNTYVAATGNAAGVVAKGLEIDGVYTGIKHVSLRFSGAYNDAYYSDFRNAAQPAENGNLKTLQDNTGKNLPGASKFSFNVGGEYRYPVLDNKEFHFDFNTAYYSRANNDVALSAYGWVPAYSITDLAIGLGNTDGKFDGSLIVKNAFNDQTSQIVTWNTYTPAIPRWIGMAFRGKL